MQYPNTQPPFPPPGSQNFGEKRRYGKVQALLLSFFSPELYRDVARRWRGIGFWYLVLLMLLTTIPMAIKVQEGFTQFTKQDAAGTLETFPSITINKGEVSIAETDPYLWRDAKTGQVLLYVDTTGAFDLPAGQNAIVKLSKHKVEYQKAAGETQTNDLSNIQYFSLDKVRLKNWMDASSHWIGILIFVFVGFFSVIGHLIQILIYGVFGMVICLMFGTRLGYPALLRLAAVAITPAIIISTVVDFAGIHIPAAGLIFFIIEMAFLAFAIKANAVNQMFPPAGMPAYAPAPAPYTLPGGQPPQPPPYHPPV